MLRKRREIREKIEGRINIKRESPKQKGSDPPQNKGKSGCFLCFDLHRFRDCPKKDRLSTLVVKDAGDDSGVDECTPRVNPIQLLNAMTTEQQAPLKGLMYVTAKVNGKVVRAKLDTGATNNFVSLRMVDQLGLKVTKSNSQVKAVNSKAQGIQGTVMSTLWVGS